MDSKMVGKANGLGKINTKEGTQEEQSLCCRSKLAMDAMFVDRIRIIERKGENKAGQQTECAEINVS